MTNSNDHLVGTDFLWTAASANHPENESASLDSADSANWESAWIDLGGEG